MKKIVLFFGGLFAFATGFSQTILFSEDFEGVPGLLLNTTYLGGVAGQTGDNYWVINNTYTGGAGNVLYCTPVIGQPFTIGNTDLQPAGISSQGGNYLHILSAEGAGNGINNSNYAVADGFACVFAASHFAGMTTDISTTGQSGVQLKFWWLNDASAMAPGELYYSLNGGATWTQKTTTTYNGQPVWTQEVLTDAAWDNAATLRFGWRFNNGTAAAASDPAFAIDDIEISVPTGCTNTTSSFTETVCFSYTVPSGDETYSTAGTQTVMDTIPNAAGCDSIMTISLTINTVDVAVNISTGTLSANSSTGTYQWIDCGDPGNVITGETNQAFSPSVSGDYAVIVTDNGCVDTSICNASGPAGLNELDLTFELYPNPSNGQVFINTSVLIDNQLLQIVDLNGRIILSKTIAGQSLVELNLSLEAGTYFISLMNEEGDRKIQRLVIK